MWVGIVGSRRLGACRCKPNIPPSEDDLRHAHVCPRVVEWVRMMHIVSRAQQQPDFEGVVSGGAKTGGDRLAKQACDAQGVKCLEYEPDPGPEPFAIRAKKRNQKVVDKAGMLIAVYAPGPPSPGTTDTVVRALHKQIPVFSYHEGRWTTRRSRTASSPPA